MVLDALLLARLQFAFTIVVHIIFPAFTIGSSAYVATLLVLWRRTGKDHFHRLARFWTKIFAVSFAMGVVSGIPLSYQFGTNWSRFSEVVGNVIGPLIGYEVLTAFFLEATFLGVMLFGWKRVPPWLHVTSAILVAFGTTVSGFWILSANSWMHTPAGHVIRDGIAYPVDWWAIVFNPSFPYRFAHMMTAAYLTTSVVVLAVGARYLLAGNFQTEGRTMMRMGLGMVAILAPLQLLIGDQHGLNTLEHQPTKIAAMEGHWDDDGPAAFVLFAVPDQKAERNRLEIAIPNVASLILTHSATGRVPALKDVPPQDRPPVANVFFAFRIMVGIGLLLILLGTVGAWLWWRKKVFETRWYLRCAGYAWPVGFIAIVAGWVTTETGRQPWIAFGNLRTADALSPVSAPTVATSLTAFVITYLTVFSIGVYYIRKLIKNGPKGAAIEPPTPEAGLANRPLAQAQISAREAGSGESVDMSPDTLTGTAFWLPLIAASIVAIAVAMYVVLDGFDLGIGILFPFFPQEADRDRMMNSVAPFWDGNETWLILGGNGLFVAFPVAYAIVMPAMYVPLITMLLALVFRGVAFEFRWVAKPHHRKWDIAFAAGSTVAALCQGLMLGGLIEGLHVENRQFAGGPFDWFTSFSVMCGLGLIVGYALIGACWIVMKTTHDLERKTRAMAQVLLPGLVAFIVVVSIWTPHAYQRIADRWFSMPNLLYLSPLPILTAVLVVVCWRGIRGRRAASAFYSAVAVFVLAFAGLAISAYPYLVPWSLTLWDVAGSPESQRFILIGIAILLPFIIGYTVFTYYTFRGKLREGEGYH